MRNDGVDWGDDTFVGSSSSRSITLTMRQGPNPGRRFTVKKHSATIGRLPTNDIPIPDQQISRHHASITWENDKFIIRDLGSANGTAVNGTPISGPHPLRDGDVISFGEIVLTFQGSTAGAVIGPESSVRSPRMAPGISGQPAGTMEMDSPTLTASRVGRGRGGGNALWPIIIGVGLALFLALIFAAVILVFILSQNQSVPEIVIQQPLSGSQAKVGQPVLVLASATDRKGVTRVEFWVDGTLNTNIPSDASGGQNVLLIQHPWTPTSSGVHNISLRAFNASGNASEPVNITIGVTEDIAQATQPSQSSSEISPSPTFTTISIVQATSTPTTVSVVVVTATPTTQSCTNDASFVADVTVPDNTIFQPGARVDKTWRIRNSGTCPWATGYRLIFVSGNKMGAPDNQPVVPTAPGGTTDITVTMYAPNNYGTHTGVWRMVNAAGEPFGQQFTIVIQVPAPYTPTPVVTPTFTPLPGPVVNIWTDKDRVNAGECTIIKASVEGVKAAWLDGEGIGGGYREKQVCPCEETKYAVVADAPSGERVTKEITIYVEGSCVVNKPDLVIRDLEEVDGNTNPSVGETIHLRLRVKNEGNVVARDVVTSWRPFGKDSGTDIFEHKVDRLEPGEDKNFYWDYVYDTPGEFTSYAKADYTNNVDEADEENNEERLTFRVEE